MRRTRNRGQLLVIGAAFLCLFTQLQAQNGEGDGWLEKNSDSRTYSAYAEDRKVPFEEVLKKLSDAEHLTPEQMHEWFKQHGYRKFRH